MPIDDQNSPTIKLPEVMKMTNYTRSVINKEMKLGKFPQSFNPPYSDYNKVWLRSEILAFNECIEKGILWPDYVADRDAKAAKAAAEEARKQAEELEEAEYTPPSLLEMFPPDTPLGRFVHRQSYGEGGFDYPPPKQPS